MIAIVRPISLNFQEPIVFLLNLYIALIYGKRGPRCSSLLQIDQRLQGTDPMFLNWSHFDMTDLSKFEANMPTALGLLYIWFESFPIVFVGLYKFNLGEEGLAFVGILVGAIIVM